jgi:hypothetical protein
MNQRLEYYKRICQFRRELNCSLRVPVIKEPIFDFVLSMRNGGESK